jgi:hypothetical protein
LSASATASITFSGGLVAGFFQAMREDGFRVLEGPTIRRHFFEPFVIQAITV